MAYYQHSLSRTQEPPNLTEYKLFYYNYLGTTSEALTIYEQERLDVLNDRKFFVILEDETTYDIFFVKTRIEDKRRKFEPFDSKEMLATVITIANLIIEKRKYDKRRAADKGAVFNQNIIIGCTN